MKLQPVAVLIPVYKKTPNQLELISLKQCFKILNKYPIIFFAPESLNTSSYEGIFNKTIQTERFDNKYFTDLKAYNRLMLSSQFYKRFKRYKYILIHQPDAYVFRDELQYWCDAGYDYIGAPWFSDWNLSGPDSAFLGIGNGGFSLRKVKSHLRVLNSFYYIKPPGIIIKKFIDQKFSLASLKQLLLDLTIKNNTYSAFNNYSDNEDIFWGMVVSEKFNYFKVPSMKTASQFSMEVNAEMLYHQNNNQLPFGCHAWEKYETSFWNKFIPVE